MVAKMCPIYSKIQEDEQYIRCYQNSNTSHFARTAADLLAKLPVLKATWNGKKYLSMTELTDLVGNQLYIGSTGAFVAGGKMRIRAINGITSEGNISLLPIDETVIQVFDKRETNAISKKRKTFGMCWEFSVNFNSHRFLSIREGDLPKENQDALSIIRERGWLPV